MTTTERTIPTRGPFSLRESTLFGFGHRRESDFDGVMRLAFRVDGDLERAVGVEVRQDGGTLHLTIHGEADPDVVARQVARILSCDHDGEAFAELGARDAVIGALQRVAPGLRPVLFHSPYEAAVWSVVSARRPRPQGIAVRHRLSAAYGAAFDLAGVRVDAVPPPSALVALPDEPGILGLPPDRVPRLRAVGAAAAAGALDVDRLVALGPEAARLDVQRLPGIGPFYSALIVVRACGFADVLAPEEPRGRQAVHALYGIESPMSDAEYAAFAQRWAPFRTWATVLIRAAADRLG